MSLKSVSLRDFVIVHALDLDLETGFTVLTGETGAGKSILIDALQLALGARADAAVVREGAQRCEISVEFDSPPVLSGWLELGGFTESEVLLIRRTVDSQGKSRAWINGSAATATQLREIADKLVDIHGQHAWQSLTRPDAVRGLLDSYGGVPNHNLSQLWQDWRAAQKALFGARDAQDSLQRERERLAWQIAEVNKLSPQPQEWEVLNYQHSRLSNAQTLRETVESALDTLEMAETNASILLSRALIALQNQAHIEPEFKAIAEVLASGLAQTEDAIHSLHVYARSEELDLQGLGQLDERLSLWISLARRYKRQPAELPDLLVNWRIELQKLDQASDLAGLEVSERSANAAYMAEARKVSRLRGKAAPALASAITQAMQGLGMQGGKFEVTLAALDAPAQFGLEQAEFLVAGHSGSTPRPVGKVASGGELSRIALAIAVTTSQLGEAQTLIFDEVDSGVGGAVAETVGLLMKRLGKDRQVMAVTHLPQVAACADHHLVVAKISENARTISTVQTVTDELRIAEVTRMLGGEKLSGATRAHAREMLGQ